MRFAHLSDLHALDLTGLSAASFWRFANKRLAGGVNLLRKRRDSHPVSVLDALCDDVDAQGLDHVVVTGDLTNLSLPSEFQRARRALERIRLGPREVTVIPGNHDAYVWAAVLYKHFGRALGPYSLGDGAAPDALPTFPFVRRRTFGDVDVSFVACSSARPSPVPFADGRLGSAQLAALEARLQAERGRFRVLLVHHPLLPQRMDFLRRLRDRDKLQAVLARTGAELVLHGHEHRDLRAELPGPDGPIPVIGVGSGTYYSQKKDPGPAARARYNVYTVERSGAGFRFVTAQRVYDPGAARFVSYVPDAPDAPESAAAPVATPVPDLGAR